MLHHHQIRLSEDGLAIHQTHIDPVDLIDWAIHLTLDLEKLPTIEMPSRT